MSDWTRMRKTLKTNKIPYERKRMSPIDTIVKFKEMTVHFYDEKMIRADSEILNSENDCIFQFTSYFR